MKGTPGSPAAYLTSGRAWYPEPRAFYAVAVAAAPDWNSADQSPLVFCSISRAWLIVKLAAR
jgi:hypothetical protein